MYFPSASKKCSNVSRYSSLARKAMPMLRYYVINVILMSSLLEAEGGSKYGESKAFDWLKELQFPTPV